MKFPNQHVGIMRTSFSIPICDNVFAALLVRHGGPLQGIGTFYQDRLNYVCEGDGSGGACLCSTTRTDRWTCDGMSEHCKKIGGTYYCEGSLCWCTW